MPPVRMALNLLLAPAESWCQIDMEQCVNPKIRQSTDAFLAAGLRIGKSVEFCQCSSDGQNGG